MEKLHGFVFLLVLLASILLQTADAVNPSLRLWSLTPKARHHNKHRKVQDHVRFASSASKAKSFRGATIGYEMEISNALIQCKLVANNQLATGLSDGFRAAATGTIVVPRGADGTNGDVDRLVIVADNVPAITSQGRAEVVIGPVAAPRLVDNTVATDLATINFQANDQGEEQVRVIRTVLSMIMAAIQQHAPTVGNTVTLQTVIGTVDTYINTLAAAQDLANTASSRRIAAFLRTYSAAALLPTPGNAACTWEIVRENGALFPGLQMSYGLPLRRFATVIDDASQVDFLGEFHDDRVAGGNFPAKLLKDSQTAAFTFAAQHQPNPITDPETKAALVLFAWQATVLAYTLAEPGLNTQLLKEIWHKNKFDQMPRVNIVNLFKDVNQISHVAVGAAQTLSTRMPEATAVQRSARAIVAQCEAAIFTASTTALHIENPDRTVFNNNEGAVMTADQCAARLTPSTHVFKLNYPEGGNGASLASIVVEHREPDVELLPDNEWVPDTGLLPLANNGLAVKRHARLMSD